MHDTPLGEFTSLFYYFTIATYGTPYSSNLLCYPCQGEQGVFILFISISYFFFLLLSFFSLSHIPLIVIPFIKRVQNQQEEGKKERVKKKKRRKKKQVNAQTPPRPAITFILTFFSLPLNTPPGAGQTFLGIPSSLRACDREREDTFLSYNIPRGLLLSL